MANVVIDIASEFTGKKAFKQAETATEKLTKSVKTLGGAIGVAFSARAIVAYGRASVNAFAADDKAARTLTKTLSNLGLGFADLEIKTFISDLERQSGVLDDFLRPAYQKLVTTTGDYRRSQALLQTALDLSAQSGVDLVTVSGDLGRAFVGNTRGLLKYNLGLNKTQLAAMSFEEVLLRITKISQGQAALAADTYAGKLNKLTVASENAKEVLGGALLDAIIKLGGGDVDKTTDKIDKLSSSLSRMIRLATGTSDMSIGEILRGVDYKYGFIPTDKVRAPRSKSPAGTYMRNQAEIKAAAEAKRIAAEQAKTQKALTKSQQDALKLAKAKAAFDMQKIQIEAALKGKLSEEDAIRLKLMKAIEEENLGNIGKYQKALEAAQEKSAELAKALAAIKATDAGNPFSKWPDYVKTAIELTNTVAQASLQAGIAAGAKLSEALSGARYAAQGAAATQAAADAAAIAGVYGSATSSATASIAAQTKAAQEAAAAQVKAAQEAAAAQLALLTAGSAEQKAALEAQLKAQSEALASQSAAQMRALQERLAEEAAAYKELADATAAAAMAALETGASTGVTGSLAKIASEAAAQAAAAAAAEAAAAQAAGSVMGGNTTKIEVTVTGDPFTDPNAVAEKVVEIIRNASNRGTVDVLGFE
jgi:hypothetical protein